MGTFTKKIILILHLIHVILKQLTYDNRISLKFIVLFNTFIAVNILGKSSLSTSKFLRSSAVK